MFDDAMAENVLEKLHLQSIDELRAIVEKQQAKKVSANTACNHHDHNTYNSPHLIIHIQIYFVGHPSSPPNCCSRYGLIQAN
jgi:hypothetical protein